MRRAIRADVEKFRQELDTCRSIIVGLSKRRPTTSFLGKQLVFWMESARFLINELEIWDRLRDDAKYAATRHKLQKNLDYVNELVTQFIEEEGDDLEPYDE